MKPLTKNAADRNIINRDNYEFYKNKILESKYFKMKNDNLKKE